MPAALIMRGIARGLHVAASLSVFGSALCYANVAPIVLRQSSIETIRRIERVTAGLIRLSFAGAALAGVVWLLLQAVYFSGGDSLAEGIAVLGPAVFETHFGHLLVVRLGLLLLAVLIFGAGGSRGRVAMAAGVAGLAVTLEAGLGHGSAMGGPVGHVLLASLVLHLLATGAWLGGLATLLIVIDGVLPAEAREVASRFSTLGAACVLILAATAAAQGWLLVGGIAALFGTAYGRVATAKLVLFVLLLGFAAANRYRFTPALAGSDAPGAQRHLHRSILGETLTGLLVVVLAGILLNLPPQMNMGTGR